MAERPVCNVTFRSFTPVYEVCKKGQNKLISSVVALKKKEEKVFMRFLKIRNPPKLMEKVLW